MLKEIFEVSRSVPRRTRYEVLAYLMEEVGELATEISIESGFSDKEPGEDGIVGEAIDVALCAIDLTWVSSPNTTEEELEEYVTEVIKRKLRKWKESKLKS